MRIVAFSDLHAYSFKPHSVMLETGISSRLNYILDCVRQVRDYAEKIKADLVLFGGDLFHERKHIRTQEFNMVCQELALFNICKIPVVMIHGNHDQADREGKYHSLYSFGSFVTVLNDPGWIRVRGREGTYTLLAIPYIEDITKLKEEINRKTPFPEKSSHSIFLGHLGVEGAELGADFIYKNPIDCKVEDLKCDRFDLGLLGHFHKHQQIADNFWYIGAPIQHNWGDSGDVRGFVEYNTETRELKHIPLDLPRFVKITDKELGSVKEEDYVRLITDKEWKVKDVEDFKISNNLGDFEVLKPKMMKTDKGDYVVLDPLSSFTDLVESYVKSGFVDLDGVDEYDLIKLGKEILEEVEND